MHPSDFKVNLAAVFSASEDISVNLTRKASDNSTEKCRTLLANLLELLTNESKAIESEVRKLTQGLISAEVEPEEYCTKLERLLHASPQPSLIHFLQKTLPMLRQAMVTKELVIEGIDPPAPRVQVSDTADSAPLTDMKSTKKKSKVLQKKPVSRKIKPGKVVKTKGGKNKDKRKQLEILLSSNYFFDDVAPVQSLDERKPFSPPATKAEPEVVAVPEEEAEAAEPHVVGEISVDGDINDVVTMAGIDVAEEYQNRSTKKINAEGCHLKLPEEKPFLDMDALKVRINAYLARQGLDPPSPIVALSINYIVRERIKNIVERLVAVTKAKYAQPYMDGCEITSNVKGQLDFLREVDMCNQKRAARERAKARQADPEAQEVQLNEEGETTETVTEAVAERSGQAHEGDAQGSGTDSSADAGPSTSASTQADGDEQPAKGPMIATMRDLIFVLEQDKYFAHSPLLYSLYLR